MKWSLFKALLAPFGAGLGIRGQYPSFGFGLPHGNDSVDSPGPDCRCSDRALRADRSDLELGLVDLENDAVVVAGQRVAGLAEVEVHPGRLAAGRGGWKSLANTDELRRKWLGTIIVGDDLDYRL
jgi:hypothetical protein